MKDLTHICTACPDYPRCNFNRERVYTESNHCRNSKEFSEFIRNMNIDEDECLVSFDITSLYTKNVLINDTINIISDLIPTIKISVQN